MWAPFKARYQVSHACGSVHRLINELQILNPSFANDATHVSAYYLWKARCERGIEGSALDDWLEAERRIKEYQRTVRENNPIYREIARKAYLFSRGRMSCGRAGHEANDWLCAEREVLRNYARDLAA